MFNLFKRKLLRNVASLLLGLSCALPANAGYPGAVSLMDSPKATYIASSGFTTLASSATDFFTFYGSSTKTIRILKIFVQNRSAATSGVYDVMSLIKRSSAPSSGTATTLTAVPLDSNNAAATATAKIWTANPTPGSSVGTVLNRAWCSQYTGNSLTAANSGVFSGDVLFDADKFGQAIILHGTAEGIALSLGGVTQGGSTPLMNVDIIWSEE